MIKCLIILLLFWRSYASANECLEGVTFKQPFEACTCTKLGIPNHIGLHCDNQRWITVPNIDKAFSSENKDIKISSISFRDGFLMYISQDAFRNTSAQSIDLSNNYIENVNVNAFRGLEQSLYQVILTGNSLSSIPHHSLTYLHQLRYLYLQQNQISEITPQTFAGIQLKNLKYFHIDKNKISVLEKGSLTNVPLQVLTASNNKIMIIEKQSLPPTLWFLDLKQNLLQSIPYLSLRELKQLQTLDLESNNITIIHSQDEVKFEKEMTLLLSNNKINQLPKGCLNSFTKINKLDLSYNQITNIHEEAFQTIASMNELDLSYNSIVHIPIKTFEHQSKSLKKLNLEENDLHTLPSALRILQALQALNMNSNKLADIDNSAMFTFKHNLTELLLACNRLISVPTDVLDEMDQLQHLDISKNRIADINKISFKHLPNLIRLNLAGNQLEKLMNHQTFDSLKSLAYLDLSFNKLNMLGKTAFEKLSGLESLFLQNNELSEFPRSSLSRLDKLRYLLLDHNQIKSLPNFAFQWLTHLERLSISRNKIESIEEKTFRAGPMHLRSLNLGFNQISYLSSRAFDSLPSLEQLFLNNNQIRKLLPQTFTTLKALKMLTLARNHIEQISEYSLLNLPNLEQLSLAKNKLKEIPKSAFSKIAELEMLDLAHNDFANFNSDFLENPVKLHILNLAHNNIKRFNLDNLRNNLEQLSLSHNKLQYLSNEALYGFEALTFVDLSHNDLIEIIPEAFHTTKQLKIINLSYNSLRRISKTTFSEQARIESLSLANNFLNDLNYGVFGKNNVVDLILRNNNFTFIPSNSLTSIRQSLTLLDLSYNSIKSLARKDLNGLQNITKLLLNHNNIEIIDDETFADMPLIQYLDISNNPITTWSPAAFKGISESLFSLNLAKTGLFSLPKITSRGLKNFNISHNKIYEIQESDITPFKKLQQFDVSWNNLVNIKPEILQQFVELRYLDFSGNKIHYVEEELLQNLDQLEVLKLTHLDQLIQFPHAYAFGKLRNLKELEIHHLPPTVGNYNITQILEVLPPLKAIDIQIKDEELNNQLKLADVRLLRKVTIRGHDLKKINIGAFEKLRGYKLDLTITETQIDTLPPLLFNTITTISFLKLSLPNNKIHFLNPFTHTKAPILNQHGTILESLNLQGNPIMCDCKLLWLRKWIEYSAEHSSNWQEIGEALDETECDARPGIHDTLLSVYGKNVPGIISKHDSHIAMNEICGEPSSGGTLLVPFFLTFLVSLIF